MKKTCTFIVILTLLVMASYGQGGKLFVSYNKLTELTGTSYVLASVENWGKMSVQDQHLLFINTGTGEHKQVDFPKDAYISGIEQIKLDTLQINKVVVSARTVNLNENKSIDWRDPMQVFIFTPDGKQQTKITNDDFFVGSWTLNRQTGVMVVLGRVDTNKNAKLDKEDKPEILLFDLKEMKQLAKQ